MMESNELHRKFDLKTADSLEKQRLRSDVGAGPARPCHLIDRAIEEFESNEFSESNESNESIGQQQTEPKNATVATCENLMSHARVLMEASEHRLAVNILRGLLIRVPDFPPALEKLGICFREDGRYEEALKCFRALNRLNNDMAQKCTAQMLIAETLYLSERDEMALAAYRELLKVAPIDGPSLFTIFKNIGNIHVRSGDFDAAEEFYNKAFALNPKSDVLMVNYGTLEIQRENLVDAVQRFRSAVEINTENDKGWVGLALVHRQMGDHDLAWANVERALDINPKNRTALRLAVDWSVADHKFSIAISRLQSYLNQDGEDAEMSFILTKIFTHVGRLNEARIEIERVLALDPAIDGASNLKSALDQELNRLSGLERN